MKKFFLSTIMALACVGANAQVETTPTTLSGEYFYGIPEVYCYDEKYSLVAVSWGNDKTADAMYVYDTDLKLIKEIKTPEEPMSFEFMDISDYAYGITTYLSQTLFNNDEKYEYIVGIRSNYYSISGIKIMSEDGEVLQTLNFDKETYDSELQVLRIGWNSYLCFQVSEDDKYFMDLYKINNSSDPSKVSIATAPVRINVSPRVAERGQDITVAAEGEGVREVVVTDAAGRVVYRTKADAGQQTVKINSHRLSSGLNVVSVKNADGKSENCKVIVKK